MTLSRHRPLAKKRGKHALAKAQGCWQSLRDFLIFLVECWIVWWFWCFWHHVFRCIHVTCKFFVELNRSITINLIVSCGWAGIYLANPQQKPDPVAPLPCHLLVATIGLSCWSKQSTSALSKGILGDSRQILQSLLTSETKGSSHRLDWLSPVYDASTVRKYCWYMFYSLQYGRTYVTCMIHDAIILSNV